MAHSHIEYESITGVESPLRHLNSRGALLAACAVLCGAVMAWYAGERWLAIVAVLLSDGLLAAAWVLAAAALGEVVVRPARLGVTGPLRFATAAGVGLGIFSLAGLGLGLAGWLGRWTAILMPAVGVLAWWAIVGRKVVRPGDDVSASVGDWLRAPAGWHWLFLAAMPSLAVAVVGASVMPGLLWRPDDPHPYDVISYHLQVPREWYELRRIAPLPHNVFSYFPFNVEVQFLLAMHARGGPWAAMYQAQFACVGYAALAVVAAYGAARVVAGRAGATIAATAVATTPWVVMSAPVCFVEGALLFYATLAVGWATAATVGPTAARGPRGQVAAMVVAGACAGLACGVKLTAGPMVLAAVPAGVMVAAVVRRGRVGVATVGGAAFVVAGLAVLAPWLVRNAVWAGNPFFPNAAGLFGPGHFSPGQVERYAAAHAVDRGAGARLAAIGSQVAFHWQYGYVLLPLAVAGLAAGARRHPAAVAVGVAAGVQVAFWAGFTHQIGRFLLPILAPAAVAIGMLDARRTTRAAAAGLAVAGAVVGWVGGPFSDGGVHARMSHFANLGRMGMFALDDVRWIQPRELQDLYDAGGRVHFVGDAQVFLHGARPAQVPYRSVFDVRADAPDPVAAWTGRPLADLPPGEWALVDPSEIDRLSRTYRHVPNLPPDFPGPRDTPFLIDRDRRVVVPER